MTAAALLLAYTVAAIVGTRYLLEYAPRVTLAAARAARNWLPLGTRRCQSCGRKNPGPNHECPSVTPTLRVPSWARKDNA